jgi:hypothetical protein
MIHMQVIGKEGSTIKSLFRTAIQDKKIKSFRVVQVKGGLRVQHAKHMGSIKFIQKKNILFATLLCNNKSKEWQILEAFIGRLTYHFKERIAGINIQFE